MWGELPVLAVVPARGGSKGIPGKNLRTVGGQSLVAWTAQVAKALPWVDRCLLTTDDPAIAQEGRRAGLEVPFLRPASLATDTASGVAVWQHAWRAAEAHYATRFQVSVYLQPTTPLRHPAEVTRTVATLLAGGHRAAATVTPLPGHFAPEKLLTVDETGRLAPHLAEGSISNRQAAPRRYYRNGICYAARREAVVERGQILEVDCAAVVVERWTPNIDDPWELDQADTLARLTAGAGGGSQ